MMKQLLILLFPVWLIFSQPFDIEVSDNVHIKTIETADGLYVLPYNVYTEYYSAIPDSIQPEAHVDQDDINFKQPEL